MIVSTRFSALTCLMVLVATHSSFAAAQGFVSAAKISIGENEGTLSIRFNCKVVYNGHRPSQFGSSLRLELESTGICNGVPPIVAEQREQFRPANAEAIHLVDLEFDGRSTTGPVVEINFDQDVRYVVAPRESQDRIDVIIMLPRLAPEPATVAKRPAMGSTRVRPAPPPMDPYVLNLAATNRPWTAIELGDVQVPDSMETRQSKAIVDGKVWYRLQIVGFKSRESAESAFRSLQTAYPSAWVGRSSQTAENSSQPPNEFADINGTVRRNSSASSAGESILDDSEATQLMVDAKHAMTAGETSKAVQIYTKVLQFADGEPLREAQEYLALARERNGQVAHAKAEYQRYLSLYSNHPDAARVSQRYNALVSGSQSPDSLTIGSSLASSARNRQSPSRWNIRAFFSQYYRRDANQLDDQDEVINQSAIFSDINMDARRRGERFDFSARLSGGYRYDLLNDGRGSGNDFRTSYAYADLMDSRIRLSGRLGRQSRNTGGVWGRFDGLNIAYDLTSRIRLEAVAGEPVYSTSNTDIHDRRFTGLSATLSSLLDGLDVGTFVVRQEIEGFVDRQSIGAELRYFKENMSLWGSVDYDSEFQELGSVFVRGSLRLKSRTTITALLDKRRSPFLNLGNALIGQPTQSFTDLALLFTADEIRQLALDRSAESSTISMGLSQILSPRVQANFNASSTSVGDTSSSGSVAGILATNYQYYSADVVASSLFRANGVGIFGLRFSNSDSTSVYSGYADIRMPFGRAWRISPRLQVDYREINSDQSTQWSYSPGIKIQFRTRNLARFEFQAGKQYLTRELALFDENRDSYFVNIGYQLTF